ncbi:hypothetical protein QUC31_005879 [Theobroma cacao]
MRSSIHSQTESIAESPLWLLIAKMLVLVFLIAIAGISLQSVPSFNHRPSFFIPRSNFPVIRAQLSPKRREEEDVLNMKEWELGMFQNEVAASQGIRIRRRPPMGPPLHYMGPFDFRLQNEDNTPCSFLEEIIWQKDVEVSHMKEKKPLASLKKFIENAARTRDFVGALKAAHSRTGLPGLIAEVKKGSPTRGILRDEVKKGLLWKKKVKKSTKIQNIMAIFRFLLLLLL